MLGLWGLESRWGHGCLSLDWCVLSGSGLCVELITRPAESYRMSSRLDNEEAPLEAVVPCGVGSDT
jgi:hypothetical protein